MRTSKSGLLNALFILAPVCLVMPGTLEAGFLNSGAEVSISNNEPTIEDVVFGPVAGPTNSPLDLVGYSFSFTDDSFTYTNPYSGPYLTAEFDGFVLTFTGIPDITNVVDDASSELDPDSIVFSSDSISFNLASENRYAGEQSVFDVTFASAVSEPGPLALLAAGLVFLATSARDLRRFSLRE